MLKPNETIGKMFAYRHDIPRSLINDNVKPVVLGRNEKLTGLPELEEITDTNIDNPPWSGH